MVYSLLTRNGFFFYFDHALTGSLAIYYVYSKFKFIVKMTRSRTTDSTSYTVLTQRFEPLLGINGYTHTYNGMQFEGGKSHSD